MSRFGGRDERVAESARAGGLAGRIRHNRLLPARAAQSCDWPAWVSEPVRTALAAGGVEAPWLHQVQAAEAARAGRHVALTTGTASGKTLGYLLPIIAATWAGEAPPFVGPAGSAAGTGEGAGADRRSRSLPDRPGGWPALPRLPQPESAQPDLGFELPAVSAPEPSRTGTPFGWRQRPHTALYLAPTKALAHDQLRRCNELGLDRWRIAVLDGDTPPEERDWARDHAGFVLTNPDLLHHTLLPQHARWRGLLQSLRYVVVDESHRYRGVFGAQVAAVLRRLRRLAAHYGSRPVFVLSSATAGDAVGTAVALTGLPRDEVRLIDRDTSPRGPVTVQLWQPDAAAEDLTAELLSSHVADGRQTIAFVASRRASEVIALQARAELERGAHPTRPAHESADSATVTNITSVTNVTTEPPNHSSVPAIEAYRGGYLATDRRRIEADLQGGRLRGVAATNALELGVDITGVDSVIICGYPGSRSALWQQAGRAGRRGHPASVSVVARRQPLDAYLLDHPEVLFDATDENAVLHPGNPYVLGPQLAAAAQELPLTEEDQQFFGADGLALAARLAVRGQLRRRAGGFYWIRPERAAAAIDLRATHGDAVDIIEEETGRVLGHVDADSADLVVHPGAVYLHLGETYLCEDVDPDHGEAFVRAASPGFWTQPQTIGDVTVLKELAVRSRGRIQIRLGEVEVSTRVSGYLRRDLVSGQVWDSTPLDLPERRVRTTALWWSLAEQDLPESLRTSSARLDAAIHAAEHVCLGLLPAFSPCDRWDVGSHSDPHHAGTGAATVFVHDRHAGGTGFAEHAFGVAAAWLQACLDRVRDCDCELGCPACILTGCGSSRGLDRAGAIALLELGT